jgi:putative peptidoglycan lipid II flippase
MAYFFGASLATDAFIAAFRIPNLLRDMFAEGALSSAFIPVFKGKLVSESKDEAFGLANIVITSVLLVVGGIVLLGILAAPAIVYLSAKGFAADPFKFALTISLTRWMFAYLLLVSLSALVMGMLNSFGRFGIPALSPAAFNLGMIFSMLLLQRFLELPVYSLAIGVLIGGVGQLAVQLPALFKTGFRLRWRPSFLDEGLKKVLRLFAPMVLGMSASRVNILLSTLLASFLMAGSISWLNYSYRLMHFPLGVFAVALGTVALPKASEVAARGNMAELARVYRETLSLNLLVILPAAVFLMLFGRDLVSLVYQHGAFTETDSANTSLALLHYSYGLIGFAGVRVTVPVYYALGDANLPTKISIFSVFVNMALYYPMIKLFGFAGLAAATSLAGLLNFGLLLYFLPRKGLQVSYPDFLLTLLRLGLAAVLGLYIATSLPIDLSHMLPGMMGEILNFLISMVIAGVLYITLCFVLRVQELRSLKDAWFGKKAQTSTRSGSDTDDRD